MKAIITREECRATITFTVLRHWALTVVFVLSYGVFARSALAQSTYHAEHPVDPQGIPARRPSGPVPRGGPVSAGSFESVQVNVDAQGENIVGDAANEPSLAIDPMNPVHMVIGWRQFDTVTSNFRQAGYAYSTDGGASWTFPGVLDPGHFRSDPVVVCDADGNYYYEALDNLLAIGVFKSTDGGVSWTGPVDANGGDKPWITVDRTNGIGRGNIYETWNDRGTYPAIHDFSRSVDGGASFEAPQLMPLPSMKFGTLDVGPDGTLYLAGVSLNENYHVFQKSTTAQDPMQTPSFESTAQTIDLGGQTELFTGPNTGGLLGQIWIATDHSSGPYHGNVYVLASVDPPGNDYMDVNFIRSTDGGATWSAPIRVNDDSPTNPGYQWFGTMSVSPNGRIDAAWYDSTGRMATVYYAYSIDAGDHWSSSIPVTPAFDYTLGYPNIQYKIGDYIQLVSDENSACLAYTATFNGEEDVYFLRIVPDCNNNGIHDGNELMAGTVSDCNGNLIPDACESIWNSIPDMVAALLDPGSVGADGCIYDLNGDERVDGRDIQLFITNRLLPP